MDLHMVSSDSTDHRHPHGLWHQHTPQTSAWTPVAVQITDINRVTGCCSNTSPHTTLSSITDHEHKHGLRWLHRPLISTWFQVASIDTRMTLSGGTGHAYQHGFRRQPEIHMALGG